MLSKLSGIGDTIQKSNDWICRHPKTYVLGTGGLFVLGNLILKKIVMKTSTPWNWLRDGISPFLMGAGSAGVGVSFSCNVSPKKLWWRK